MSPSDETTAAPSAGGERLRAAAGSVPARGEPARWRQVTLLALAGALDERAEHAVDLGVALLALDHPVEAELVLNRADDGDPWVGWWRLMAAGQAGTAERFEEELERLQGVLRALENDPDAREVARRVADLAQERAAFVGDPSGDGARFAVLGHRARPRRRMLIAGRSGVTYLADPGWDSLRPVRLGPTSGVSVGNRALLSPLELIAAVRRGDAGLGRDVPADAPPPLAPDALLEALREDVAARDRRLIELAREVADERQRLHEERVAFEAERKAWELERAGERMRRRRAARSDAPPAHEHAVRPPRTAGDALALLGLRAGATPADIERAWREQVVLCHPDRVGGLHPNIRGQAEGLTVALNAARDLLLAERPARSRR